MTLRSLREAQYNYNRMMSDHLQRERRKQPKHYTWTINESDVKAEDLILRDWICNTGNTCIFKRYEPFCSQEVMSYERLPTLTKALLRFEDNVGCKRHFNNAILNNAWMVNLKTSERENVMMDSFLRGFGQDLKKQWEDKIMNTIDISEELADLMKVYTEAEEHLKKKEAGELETMNNYMRRYMQVQDERRKVTDKLNALKHKMERKACDECDEEDDE